MFDKEMKTPGMLLVNTKKSLPISLTQKTSHKISDPKNNVRLVISILKQCTGLYISLLCYS